MKYISSFRLLFLFWVIFTGTAKQNFGNTSDSLLLLLKNNTVNRENIFNELAVYYLSRNDSQCIEYATKVLKSSEAQHNSPLRFQANYTLGQYYLLQSDFKRAFQNISAAQELAGSLTQKAQTDIAFAELSIKKGKYLDALEHLRLAKSNTDNNEIGFEVYLNEGICYYYLNEPNVAKQRFDNALKIAQLIQKNPLLAKVFYQMGRLNFESQLYPESFYDLTKSIQYQGIDTLAELYGQALSLIGQIYSLQDNQEKAYKYFSGAFQIFQSLRNTEGLAKTQYFLGVTSLALKNYSKAMAHIKLAALYFETKGDLGGTADCYLAYAEIALNTHDYAKTAEYLQKSMSLSQELFTYSRRFDLYFIMARWQFAIKNYHDAIESLETATQIADKNANFLQLSKGYKKLSEFQYSYGQYKASVENLQLANTFSDSLNHLLHNDEMRYLQSEHETNRTKTVIDLLTIENKTNTENLKKNKALLKKQNSLIFTASIVLFLFILIVFVLALWLRQKRRAHDILKTSNRQIAQQKEEIEVQRQYLLDINAELEKLSIVARETYNGIKVLNEVGRVMWINEGYTKMFGYTLSDLQDVNSFNLLGENANVDINQLVNVWYGDKKPITFESRIKTKFGTNLWVQTTLTPILDSKGKIDKMIAIDTDITQLKQAEEEIRLKNLDITSSISYAKRIQEAMMSPFDIITEHYPQSFCFYKPKSIVSGDFYWMTTRHERLIIVCADSTGHGVPGAFMSLIGISFLNKIVNEKGFVSPSVILNRLRMNIISHLHQKGTSTGSAGDGMDVSVVSIDRKNMLLEYAGAMNPVYIVRDGNLIELKPDRMPVGFFDNETRPFSSTSLSLKNNDQLYLFTDGFYDQFGGLSGGKMKSSRFKEMLKDCALKPIEIQEDIITKSFESWKGNNSQVDDILLMGIVID